MRKTTLSTSVFVCMTVLFAAAWLTNAGPLTPPAGPVASTGVTTQELADLIASGDPCECVGLGQSAFKQNADFTLLQPTANYYVKRVTVSKSSPTADIYFELREPSSGVIGFYRLRPDEGSLVADIDMVLTGLETQNLSISSGTVNISVTFKNAP